MVIDDNADTNANERSGGDGSRVGNSDDSILLDLEAANKRIDDLSMLCQDKDKKVSKSNWF